MLMMNSSGPIMNFRTATGLNQPAGAAINWQNTLSVQNTGSMLLSPLTVNSTLTTSGLSILGINAIQAAPSATTIAGTSAVQLGGISGNSLFIGQYPTSNMMWMQASYTNPTTAVYPLAMQPLGGNVGIGTGSIVPTTLLQVNGTISGTSLSNGMGQILAAANSGASYYSAGLRNDGSSVYLIQSSSNSTLAGALSATSNSYRPFAWNLSTGIVTIDGTGVGTIFGGNINITGTITATTFNGAGTGLTGTAANLTAGTANYFNSSNQLNCAGAYFGSAQPTVTQQGVWIGWNQSATSGIGQGETNFINQQGSGPGGWNWQASTATNIRTTAMSLSSGGNLVAFGAITATGSFNGSGAGLTGTASGFTVGASQSLAGGVASSIPYQTGVGLTAFITAPTIASTYLSWNGTAFVWATAGGGSYNPAAVAITGGSIDGTAIGATTASTGAFTSLSSTADATIHGLTIGLGGGTNSTNTVVGNAAMPNSTSGNNTAIGYSTLLNTTSGGSNTALGSNSLYSNTTGTYNTAVGVQSGYGRW